MQKTNFEFTPTKKDYRKSFWIFTLKNWLQSILLPLIFLGFLAGLALRVFLSDWADNFFKFLVISVFITILFLLIYLYLIHPIKIANDALEAKQLGVLLKYEADAEALSFKSPYMETRQTWENFLKIIESPHYFLLVYKTNKNAFQIIPKRAFLSNEELLAFTDLIKSNINPASVVLQKPKPKQKGKTLLLIGVILAAGGSFLCLLLMLLYNLSE